MSLLSLPKIPDGAVPKEISNGMTMNEQSRAPCSVDRCWQFEDQKMFDTKIHKEAKSHASEQDLDMAVDRAVTPRKQKDGCCLRLWWLVTWQYFRKLSGNIVAECCWTLQSLSSNCLISKKDAEHCKNRGKGRHRVWDVLWESKCTCVCTLASEYSMQYESLYNIHNIYGSRWRFAMERERERWLYIHIWVQVKL